MAYYTGEISNFELSESGRMVIARGETSKDCVQCYVAGSLFGYQRPVAGSVEFVFSILDATEIVFLLAVDLDNAETDYFDDAFPEASANGNKIKIRSFPCHAYTPEDKWRVYRGDAGDASAADKIEERWIHPNGQYAGGFGSTFGEHFGFGSYGAGFGSAFGYDFGYGSPTMTKVTESLVPGDYPIKTAVIDEVENESAVREDDIVLNTYPRPATGLAITSYDYATDVLIMSFTASGDL